MLSLQILGYILYFTEYFNFDGKFSEKILDLNFYYIKFTLEKVSIHIQVLLNTYKSFLITESGFKF